MDTTRHYGLKKPGAEDFYNVGDQNGNMDAIDGALDGLEKGKASLGADGKVPAEQLPEMDYEARLKGAPAKETPADADGVILVDAMDQKTKKLLWSRVKAVLKGWLDTLYAAAGHTHTATDVGADTAGAAGAVQAALNAHTGNRSNPHGVTAAQVGAVPVAGGSASGPISAPKLTGTKVLAGQGKSGGYSFAGDGAEDTGMFSDRDGDLYFLKNGVVYTFRPTPAEIGAAAASHSHTAAQVGADASGAAQGVQNNLNNHAGNRSNPHGVTAAQVGAAAANHTHPALGTGIISWTKLGARTIHQDVIPFPSSDYQDKYLTIAPAIANDLTMYNYIYVKLFGSIWFAPASGNSTTGGLMRLRIGKGYQYADSYSVIQYTAGTTSLVQTSIPSRFYYFNDFGGRGVPGQSSSNDLEPTTLSVEFNTRNRGTWYQYGYHIVQTVYAGQLRQDLFI